MTAITPDEAFMATLWAEPERRRYVRIPPAPDYLTSLAMLTALGHVTEQPARGPGNDTARLDAIPHIDTPKPLTKRQKRRLRGKHKEARP